MDENTIRDTHFKNAAQCLTDAIYDALHAESIDFTGRVDADEFDPLVQPLIARFAYDLGEYVYNHTTEAMTHFDTFESLIEAGDYPDLKEWPEP